MTFQSWDNVIETSLDQCIGTWLLFDSLCAILLNIAQKDKNIQNRKEINTHVVGMYSSTLSY